tara:strand:- start:182 stop:451 length:270 start_codon:yes stop_codon:yes gene_type:complete
MTIALSRKEQSRLEQTLIEINRAGIAHAMNEILTGTRERRRHERDCDEKRRERFGMEMVKGRKGKEMVKGKKNKKGQEGRGTYVERRCV